MKAAQDIHSDDHWLLTDGVAAIGPVSFESVRRFVVERRVSSDAMVRHSSWQIWRSATEITNLTVSHRGETVRNLAEICAGVDARAATAESTPPPPPDSQSLRAPASDSERPIRASVRPIAVDPVGVLAATDNLRDGLLLALSTAVASAQAEVGLLHESRLGFASPVTVGGHGPGVELLLGEKMVENDPSLAAAHNGVTVIAEPEPGPAGRFVLGRLARCLRGPRGAVMIPLVLRDQLLATFEFGRTDRPFLIREVARMQEVVEALTERIVVMGWADA